MRKLIPFAFLTLATFDLVPLIHAQDTDAAIGSAIKKKAIDAAKRWN